MTENPLIAAEILIYWFIPIIFILNFNDVLVPSHEETNLYFQQYLELTRPWLQVVESSNLAKRKP